MFRLHRRGWIQIYRGSAPSHQVLPNRAKSFRSNASIWLNTVINYQESRRKKVLQQLPEDTFVLKAADVELPVERTALEIDFKAMKIRPPDRALASLAVLASKNCVLSLEMLRSALALRFSGKTRDAALSVVDAAAGFSDTSGLPG